jgi:hypothetical protein
MQGLASLVRHEGSCDPEHDMKQMTAVLATSALDADGDQLSEQSLQGLVDQMNDSWMPVTLEHDPRRPPVGRVVSAKLVHRPDELLAVEGELELFEVGDEVLLSEDRKESDIERDFAVMFDRSYGDPADRADVEELAKILGGRLKQEFKKSVDPISVLTVFGLWAISQFAGGFVQKLGADGAEAFKAVLKRIFTKAKAGERLLQFKFAFERDGVSGVATVILTDPKPEEIDALLSDGLAQLSASLARDFDGELGIRQVTYKYRDRTLEFSFALRRDAVPVALKKM